MGFEWHSTSGSCKEDEEANGIDNILDGDKKKLHFGEIILEILTYGRLKNVGPSIQSKLNDVLLREIYNDNEVCSTNSLQEEIKPVVDVALLCTISRPADRPSMEDALKLMSGLKTQACLQSHPRTFKTP